MPSRKSRHHDKGAVKAAARGRELEILAHFGITSGVLDGRAHPCPKAGCGGTDRFRLVDAAAGAVFCNKCLPEEDGDFLAAVKQWTGRGFTEAYAMFLRNVPWVRKNRTAEAAFHEDCEHVARAYVTEGRFHSPLSAYRRFNDIDWQADPETGLKTLSSPLARIVWDRAADRLDVFPESLSHGRGKAAKAAAAKSFVVPSPSYEDLFALCRWFAIQPLAPIR